MPTLMQKIKLAIRGWSRRREEANEAFIQRSAWQSPNVGRASARPPSQTPVDLEGLVCAFLGAHFYRRLRRVNRFIELKRREGYEGLLELLNTRDGRQRFDEIRVFSEKTEKEKIK